MVICVYYTAHSRTGHPRTNIFGLTVLRTRYERNCIIVFIHAALFVRLVVCGLSAVYFPVGLAAFAVTAGAAGAVCVSAVYVHAVL